MILSKWNTIWLIKIKLINEYAEDTDICSEVCMDMFITFGAIIDNSDNCVVGGSGSETDDDKS